MAQNDNVTPPVPQNLADVFGTWNGDYIASQLYFAQTTNDNIMFGKHDNGTPHYLNFPNIDYSGKLPDKFHDLYNRWYADTYYLSSYTTICIHDAFQKIIGMGEPALFFLFPKLQETYNIMLCWALTAITCEDPITVNVYGRDAVECWLTWGREHFYLMPPFIPESSEA